MMEAPHASLKDIVEICCLGVFEKTVKVMGQSKASHNLLYVNEINLWDWS